LSNTAVPENLATDVSLLLFGGSVRKNKSKHVFFLLRDPVLILFCQDHLPRQARDRCERQVETQEGACVSQAIVAIIVALLVLPETKGLPTPETIVDAVRARPCFSFI
jgi:hypothetical protein